MPRGVARKNLHFNCTVSIGGTARIGIVREAVLGAKLGVDAIEDDREFLNGFWIKHRPARSLGNGLQGMFPGSVSAILVLHGPNNDGVEKNTGTESGFAGRFKVSTAGSFAAVGDHDDDAAAVVWPRVERAGAEENRVVDGSTRSIRDAVDRRLKGDDIGGKFSHLRY